MLGNDGVVVGAVVMGRPMVAGSVAARVVGLWAEGGGRRGQGIASAPPPPI